MSLLLVTLKKLCEVFGLIIEVYERAAPFFIRSLLLLSLLLFKNLAHQGWERVDTLYQSEDPKPNKNNPQKERRKSENGKDKKGESSSSQENSIDIAFKTRQPDTIVHAVNNIVP